MNFDFTDIQKDIIDIAKKFGEKEIAPIVDQDEEAVFFRKDLFPKLGAAGLIGVTAPEDFGGTGLGTMEYALALEALAYHSTSYALSLSVSGLPQRIIQEYGTEEQKRKYLPGIISGEKIGAFCLTEANSGSDAGAMATTAKKDGDHYVINGQKQFITHGEHAGTMIVMARTCSESRNCISAFIVDGDSKGIKGGKFEEKMGLKASPTQELFFENVKVPAENLLQQEGMGFKIALSALDGGRISIAAIACGLARAALDASIKYAKEREQFGRSIMDFQAISFMLADMSKELEASRLLTYKAAFMRDNCEDKSESTLSASMAKLGATEMCMQLATNAVQVLGGYGYIKEYKVERYMREAKVLQIVEGTSQIQRLVISKKL